MISFCEEWEVDRKIGTQKLNDIRLITEGSCQTGETDRYYEFKVYLNKEPFIAVCDIEDKPILDKYKWFITKSRDKFAIKTSVRENSSSTSKNAARMIMDGENICKVRCIDGNHLNLRRSNLEVVYIKESFTPCTESPQEQSDPYVSRWVDGKFGGSLSFKKDIDAWSVRFQSPAYQKVFRVSKYGSVELAKEAAKAYKQIEAKNRGLMRNPYRIHTPLGENPFIEIKSIHKDKAVFWFCDLEDMSLVKEYLWHIQDNETTFRVKTGSHDYFHVKLGLYKNTDHIDGNPLNNRRSNLRDGKIFNPQNYPIRKDNTTGVTGVSFNNLDHAWIVQWPEDGRRRKKTFTVCKTRTDEEAKNMAIEFRRAKDLELGLHVQQRM